MLRHQSLYRAMLLVMLTTGVGACATLSKDGGEGAVRAAAGQRLGLNATTPENSETLEQRRNDLLAKPLSSDDAVTLALLNNPGLQREFAELQLTEAEIVAASRVPNPRLSLTRLRQNGEQETDRAASLDLMSLLTTPVRASFAKRQQTIVRQAAEQAMLALARDTRLAYVDAVAARQRQTYAETVLTAAEAGRTLAQRLAQAGNISRLDAAREHAFYADAVARLARATHEASVAREQLLRLLGESNADAVQLPTQLPSLPVSPRELTNVEQQALDQRLDVQRARQQVANTAKALKLTRVTRFINVLELGYQANSFSDQPNQRGVEVSLELPIFDFGSTRVAQAEAIYRRALADVAETAINARSEARVAYGGYRTAYDLARHYRDEVVPLQQQIADELQLRYNGMLISTFELLAQSREQIAAHDAALAALSEFWRADAELAATLQGSTATTNSAGVQP